MGGKPANINIHYCAKYKLNWKPLLMMTSIHLWKLILLIPPANYAWRRTKVKKPCSVCSTTSFPSFVRTLIRWNEPSRPLAFYDLLFYTALLFKETSQSIRKQFVLHHINGETQFFAHPKSVLFLLLALLNLCITYPNLGRQEAIKTVFPGKRGGRIFLRKHITNTREILLSFFPWFC